MGALPYNNEDIYVAPMLYGGPNSYQAGGWNPSVLQQRIDLYKAWPKEKTILTFQAASASICLESLAKCTSWTQDPVSFLAAKVKAEGFAGLLGWPDSEANNAKCMDAAKKSL